MLTLKMLPSTTAVFSMFIYVSFYFLSLIISSCTHGHGGARASPSCLRVKAEIHARPDPITGPLTERQTVGNDGEDKRTFNLENLL